MADGIISDMIYTPNHQVDGLQSITTKIVTSKITINRTTTMKRLKIHCYMVINK